MITTQFGAKAQEKSPIPQDPEILRILEQRIDVEKQSLGIVIGVIDTNGRRIVPYGRFGANDARKVDGDTIFEIGSITKVFTALALADMAKQGEVSLDDPVAKYLPTNVTVPERDGKAERLRVLASQVERLERDIDSLNDQLAPLTSFVLPGGTPASAYLHLARTICRRAERIMVELAARPDERVNAAGIQYMNRLSDFLFVASRFQNNQGAGDVLWVPGQNR